MVYHCGGNASLMWGTHIDWHGMGVKIVLRVLQRKKKHLASINTEGSVF